jgi:hypothetical protein
MAINKTSEEAPKGITIKIEPRMIARAGSIGLGIAIQVLTAMKKILDRGTTPPPPPQEQEPVVQAVIIDEQGDEGDITVPQVERQVEQVDWREVETRVQTEGGGQTAESREQAANDLGVDWKQVEKSIQEGVDSVDWKEVGESIKKGVESVDWKEVGQTLEEWARSVDWNAVGQSISDAFEEPRKDSKK